MPSFFKHNWFLLSILLVIFLGYQFEWIGLFFYPKSSYLAFLAIFFTTLKLNLSDFKLNLDSKKSLVFANFLIIIVTPFLFYYSIQLLYSLNIFNPENKDILIGFTVLGIVPTTIVSHIVLSQKANGNAALSSLITIVNNFFAMLSIPLFLYLFSLGDNNFSTIYLLKKTVLIIIAPIILAQIIKQLYNKSLNKLNSVFPLLAQFIVLIFIALSVSINKSKLLLIIFGSTTFIKVLLLVVFLHFFLLILSHYLGKKLGFSRANRISLLFAASQKSLNVAIPIVSDVFTEASMAALVIVCYHIFQLLFDSVLADRIRRKGLHFFKSIK